MKKIFAFLCPILLVCSCLSLNFEKTKAVSPNTEVPAPVKEVEKYIEVSMQEQHDSGRWISGMRNGTFIIIGVSGRLTRADDEIPAAKLDAARKASMYHGIQGSIESSNTTGGTYFDYSANSNMDLQYDTNYDQYTERLSFDPEKDVIRGQGATYVRFKYNVSGPSDVVYLPEQSGSRPAWTYNRNLPQFQGYTTVMGYAGKRTRLRDTISASCDSAAAKLIESASSSVTAGESSVTGYSSSVTIHIHSEGRLTNFHVMEIWNDPDSGAVFTLAAACVSK